jgi:very-short-patch-repair endonuclease
MLPYDRSLRDRSRQLRNDLTPAEQFLWSKMKRKQLGCWFYRQKPVGIYIADFYCPSAKLVIETDGGQHMHGKILEYDKARNEYISGIGLRILRFTNRQVLTNIGEVIKRIKNLGQSSSPLRKRRVSEGI